MEIVKNKQGQEVGEVWNDPAAESFGHKSWYAENRIGQIMRFWTKKEAVEWLNGN